MKSFVVGALFVALAAGGALANEMEVGVFVAPEQSCSIKSAGKTQSCGKGARLMPGDVVQTGKKKPGKLMIKWVSQAVSLEPTGVEGQYKVVFKAPKDKKSLLGKATEFLAYAKATSKVTTIAATRGGGYSKGMPGTTATLLPGKATTLSWNGKQEKVFVTDETGNIVFQREVLGQTQLVLTPEDLRMKPGATYKWGFSPTGADRKMRLLDEEALSVLKSEFSDIEKNSKLGANDKLLAKASFAQTFSLLYPEEVKLEWLCYDLISSNDKLLYGEEKETARFLMASCQDQLEEEDD